MNRFKSLGSNGSGALSVPRPIESPDKGCFALLDKLMGIRAQEKACSSHGNSTRESSATASSIHSQPRLMANTNNSDSQAVFATQRCLSQEIDLFHLQNGASQSLSNLGTDKQVGPVDAQAKAVRAKGTPSLGPPRGLVSRCAHEAEDDTYSSTHASDLVSILGKNSGTRPMITEKLAGADLARSNVIEGAISAKLLDEAREGTATDFRGPVQQHMNRVASASSSIEEKIPLKTASPNSSPVIGPKNLQFHRNDHVSTIHQSQERSSKKRKLNDRIRSRDVRISQDQEALLSRPGSWLPAEPCQREPQANVPIALLQAFNWNADQSNDSAITQEPESRGACTENVMNLGDDAAPDTKAPTSDIESDIASEEWPPSPERDPLPPDTSPPSITHIEEQREALKACDSPPLTSPSVSAQPEGTSQSPLQETELHGGSEHNDETTTTTTKEDHQVASPVETVNPPPQYIVIEPSQGPALFLAAKAKEPQVSPESRANPWHTPTVDTQSKAREQNSEAFHSSASTADSDIEMTVPMPLHKSMPSQVHVTPLESFPSTADGAKHPFTQVKRTPYPTGNTCNSSKGAFMNDLRSNVDNDHKPPKHTVEERNVKCPSTASTFVSNPDSFFFASHAVSDNRSTSDKITPLKSFVEVGHTSKELTRDTQVGRLDGEAPSSKAIHAGAKLDNVRQREPYDPQEPSDEALGSDSPVPPLHRPLPIKRGLQATHEPNLEKHSLKREKTKPSFFYPNRSRQRGKRPVALALDISYIPDDLPDPAISARKHREDWFAARRSSESSAARESPISVSRNHVMSMSSPPGRSTQSSSGIATPLYVDSAKMTHEDVSESITSTPVAKKIAYSYNDSPQRSGWEPQANMDVASLPAPNTAQMPHSTKGSSIPEAIQTRGITEAANVPRKDKDCCGQTEFKPTRSPEALQTPSLSVQPSESGHANVLAGTVAHAGSSAVSTSPLQSNEAIQAQRSSDQSLDVLPELVSGGENQVGHVSSLQSTFTLFRNAYPDYDGDVKHFLTLCRKIEKLGKCNSLPRSMWDDFLIRHKSDYAHHVRKCMETGDDPMPYDVFYNDEIEEPAYRKRIINPSILGSIINGGDSQKVAFSRDISTNSTPATTRFSCMNTGAISENQRELERLLEPAVVIDLTNDDQGNITSLEGFVPQSSPPKQSSSQRQVPWITNSNAQTSLTPKVNCQSMITQRQPVPPGSQRLFQSVNRDQNIGDGTDTIHRAIQSSRTLTALAELPPTKVQERHSVEHKAKSKETRVDKTWSMPKKAPLKHSSADTRLEGQDQDSVPAWWQDENAPFKTFVRSYLAIRPGNGNAFAKPEDTVAPKRRCQAKVRKLRHLNVLGWNLEPEGRAEAP